MKKNITYLCMAAAALLASSCTQNEEITPTIENDRVAVRFSSNMVPLETKAVDGTLAHRIGIYMFAENTPLESNVEYVAATTGEGSADLNPISEPLYYPADGSNVSFRAYYPSFVSAINKVVKVENDTWTANLSNQKADGTNYIDQVDLLTATTGENTYNKKTTDPVSLSFEHRLAYVNIEITEYDNTFIKSSGISNMTVKLTNQPVTVHYGILTDELSAEAANEEGITFAGLSGGKKHAIVYPGESNNSKFVFTIPSKDLNFESDADLTFEAELPDVTFEPGTQYNYSVKLNYTPATAKFTASITDWKTVDMTNTTLEAEEISE